MARDTQPLLVSGLHGYTNPSHTTHAHMQWEGITNKNDTSFWVKFSSLHLSPQGAASLLSQVLGWFKLRAGTQADILCSGLLTKVNPARQSRKKKKILIPSQKTLERFLRSSTSNNLKGSCNLMPAPRHHDFKKLIHVSLIPTERQGTFLTAGGALDHEIVSSFLRVSLIESQNAVLGKAEEWKPLSRPMQPECQES